MREGNDGGEERRETCSSDGARPSKNSNSANETVVTSNGRKQTNKRNGKNTKTNGEEEVESSKRLIDDMKKMHAMWI